MSDPQSLDFATTPELIGQLLRRRDLSCLFAVQPRGGSLYVGMSECTSMVELIGMSEMISDHVDRIRVRRAEQESEDDREGA